MAVLQFLLAKVHQNDVWNHRFDDLCIMMMIMIAMMVTFMSFITSLALYDDDENNIGKVTMVMMGRTMAMLQGIKLVHQELQRVAWL